MASYRFKWYVTAQLRSFRQRSRHIHTRNTCIKLHANQVRLHRPHVADEVIVTGTFDNWAKDTKLDQKGRFHEKVVEIPETKDEILYKVRDIARLRVMFVARAANIASSL